MTSDQDTHVIYIPGLGDGYDSIRQSLLGLWHYGHITVELVPMSWRVDEGFETKLQRVYAAIDRALVKNKKVVLIGESAGGSMAVNVYARRTKDIEKVVTLCGKNTHPETVSPRLYVKNPAFRDSMSKVSKSISSLSVDARHQFTSLHPIFDPVVPVHETLFPGCRQVRIIAFGHLITILLLISVFSWITVREIRR